MKIGPRTEELLYHLLSTADFLMRPTWCNLNESFETWAWRNGLGRRLAELERLKLIERQSPTDLARVVRLTDAGMQLALGGRNPSAEWNRSWDGQWRLAVFDLPTDRAELRQRFLRVLRRHHFGYLQGSVWVTPDPADEVRAILHEIDARPETFLLMEGRPAAGESDNEIVQGAWNFELINRHYEQYLTYIEKSAAGGRPPSWWRRENALWRTAVNSDPLLPSLLLPRGYLGRDALQARKQLLTQYHRSDLSRGA